MSQENVELVRADVSGVQTPRLGISLGGLHAERCCTESRRRGDRRGHELIRQFSASDAFESQELDPQEFIEYKEKLLVTLTARARGKGSGIEIEQRGFHVLTLRGGKIARLEIYFEKADALDALHRTGVERSDDVS